MAPPPSPFDELESNWYGNIQYLINISALGAISCLSIFILLKLRSDHRSIPGPSALFTKLLAVWHASAREIALHCGADASQFLLIEGGSFALLSSISLLALFFILPFNLYAGTAFIDDLFSKTTITHFPKASPLLWFHFLFVLVILLLVHFAISDIEQRLKVTRLSSTPNSTALFTIMLQGVPKGLASDKTPLSNYFQHRYPGKVYKVIVPMDLCYLEDLVQDLVQLLMHQKHDEEVSESSTPHWFNNRRISDFFKFRLGFNRSPGLEERRAKLENELSAYKEGRGPGAGVAFVVFKDVYTANKAVKDLSLDKRMRIGRFFSLTELQLERNQWRVERAPLATDIYWNHLGSTKLSLKFRRILVNSSLLLLLLFFTSPLAVISALQSAARIINAEAMDSAQSWLSWLQSSSWIAAIFFQFLPNVLVFVSMYILIPAALSYLSNFERHLTISGEQRAALIKMVCFFLVNLIVLRGLVESSLENTILSMGRCYLDGEDCKRIEQYMSASFLAKSCLSSLAFLITCTFLGISFDLLAPIPWIKRNLQKFRKNDMLQFVPEPSEDYPLDSDSLRRPLMSEETFEPPPATNGGRMNVIDLQGYDLSVYPVSRTSPIPKPKFDFALYYAFNLTIFALTMIYSTFAPLIVPVGAVYFGYRYMVDKYNFLFVYRVRGFPAGNDGRLMDTVLSIMRFCVDLFLLSVLLFFSIHGDSMKLQAIFTLGLLVMYKLLPSGSDGFQPAILEGMQTVDQVVEGPIDYEVFSQPRFECDTTYS